MFKKFFAWIWSLVERHEQIKKEFAGDKQPCENGGCCGCDCVPTPPTHKGNG